MLLRLKFAGKLYKVGAVRIGSQGSRQFICIGAVDSKDFRHESVPKGSSFD
jgi:hypothetical protein